MKNLVSDPEERHLFRELVEQCFTQLPTALLTSLLLSILLVVVLWPLFSAWRLLGWLAAASVVSLCRFALLLCFHHCAEDRFTLNGWLRLFSWGAVLNGATWGVTPLLFFAMKSPQTNVFIAFVLGGLTAGAAASMAPLKVTMRVFTSLVCGPVAVVFILAGGNLHLVMGVMMILFGGAYLVMSSNIGRMIVNSLRLRHANLREIEERRKAETELRRIRADLEDTVQQRTAQLLTANKDLSREVAERRQAEMKLRRSEIRYRSLVESTSDCIWEVDTDGVYTYCSPSVEAILGYTPAEVLGRAFHEFMPADEATRTRKAFERHRDLNLPLVNMVNRSLHRDGQEVVIETNGEPVFDDSGELTGFRGVDRDITLRVRHEEESRRIEHLQSLGLLAGGIAHDFNNLLTVVFGNIELARTEIPPESMAAKALSDSTAAMEQARLLTGELLTFSQGGNPMLEEISIGGLVTGVCRSLKIGSEVTVVEDIDEGLWPLEADPQQIRQVLQNILDNAVEAMPDGGEILVSVANQELDERSGIAHPGGRFVVVSVRDHGQGIDPVDLPRVFDPYFTTKGLGAEKGTGIGLAVCHSVVEKHGGQVTLDSVPGEGTTVSVYLPAAAGGALAVPADKEEKAEGLRVLLLEDNESVIRTTSRLIEHLGHSVVVARDSAESVQMVVDAGREERPFDLLLLDLQIRGGMGGEAVLKRVRSFDPDIPAVVTSGFAEEPAVVHFREHGFIAALVKPFTLDDLRSLIEELLPSGTS